MSTRPGSHLAKRAGLKDDARSCVFDVAALHEEGEQPGRRYPVRWWAIRVGPQPCQEDFDFRLLGGRKHGFVTGPRKSLATRFQQTRFEGGFGDEIERRCRLAHGPTRVFPRGGAAERIRLQECVDARH